MSSRTATTLLPFLYLSSLRTTPKSTLRAIVTAHRTSRHPRCCRPSVYCPASRRCFATQGTTTITSSDKERLDPTPSDYGRSIFQDRCSLVIHAGSGGNGCVSFLREKYIEEGPPNGGDGGTGGNVFIQAIEGLTSLHKLARRRIVKAGRGQNGRGKSMGGQRGDDVLLQVPVGTVVREVGRYDPVAEKLEQLQVLTEEVGEEAALRQMTEKRENWMLYAGAQPSDFFTTDFPTLEPPRRSNLSPMQPPAPIHLDLSNHMDKPMLLAAGAVGGFGNPHFATRLLGRPKFATKGEGGMKLEVELELKLLADVGLVGLPNAGKSTLLRSITNSRTRIGNWAFTTLSPNIGTVVVDNLSGRPLVETTDGRPPRTRFTIADIPGLIEDAHMDKGLGLGFLRHIERAGVLAFVIDLSAGDAVQALKGLWRELDEYQLIRERELNTETESRLINWGPSQTDFLDEPRVIDAFAEDDGVDGPQYPRRRLPELETHPVYTKPWFVIGTKADLPGTQENFLALRAYLADIEKGVVDHPARRKNAWRERLFSVPISAINAQGVSSLPEKMVRLLDHKY